MLTCSAFPPASLPRVEECSGWWISPMKWTRKASACSRVWLDWVLSASIASKLLIWVNTQSLAQAVFTSVVEGLVNGTGMSTKCQGAVPVGELGLGKTCWQLESRAEPPDWKSRSSSAQVDICARVRLPRRVWTGPNWPD